MAVKEVTAAGAVVTRETGGVKEFLMVYREYRQDWTFPKGKLDAGEFSPAAAVREVREETGFAIKLGQRLPSTHYEIPDGTKVAHYWSAKEISGKFIPNDEVSKIAWAKYSDAKSLLTHERDLEVLKAANSAVETVPLILLRHTQAMKRSDWQIRGDARSNIDAYRPLTSLGRSQASLLVPALAAFGIEHIHSSDSYRCRDTVGPFASARSASLVFEPTMSEERHTKKPKVARTRMRKINAIRKPLVLCTHRPVMHTIMESLSEIYKSPFIDADSFDPALTPGSMVIFHRDATDLTQVVSIERHIR
ncbi:MAG: NUDIX hydrolase [Actinomycetes bacterium]